MIDVLEAATLEFIDAAVWYEERAPGLGERFLTEIQAVFELIAIMPMAGSPWLLRGVPEGTRHVPLKAFRHSVVYVTEPRLVVVAVMHSSRQPRYWIDRLQGV